MGTFGNTFSKTVHIGANVKQDWTKIKFNLVNEGHSIGVRLYWSLVSNTNTIAYYNYAVSGSVVSDIVSRAATVDSKLVTETATVKNILPLWIGVNDIHDNATCDAAYAGIKTYCQNRVTAGWTVFAITCTPWNTEVSRARFNNLMRTDLSLLSKVYIIDTDMIPELNNSHDLSYYEDGLHVAGKGIQLVKDLYLAKLKSVYKLNNEVIWLGNEIAVGWADAGHSFWDAQFMAGWSADGSQLICDGTSGQVAKTVSPIIGKRYKISITATVVSGHLSCAFDEVQSETGLYKTGTIDYYFLFKQESLIWIDSKSFNGTITAFSMKEVVSDTNQSPVITFPTSTDLGYAIPTVGATLDCKGLATTWSIEYGATNAYGSEQAGSTTSINGVKTVGLTGLTPNGTYRWRFKAINSYGTTYSADQSFTLDNVSWVIPVTGRTSGTPTAGTMTIVLTQNDTITSTGDVTVSVVQADDNIYKKQTVTINCPNNGSGTVVIPNRSRVISLGNFRGGGYYPNVNYYAGNDTTAPIISLSINNLPSTLLTFNQAQGYTNILPITGYIAFPTSLTYLYMSGGAWAYSGAMPTGLTHLYLSGTTIAWTYSGAMPTGLMVLSMSGIKLNWTGLDIGGTGNITQLNLIDYRVAKISSADMVTLLTSLTNRVGTLPATITINDYADYASPPTIVTDAVTALKSAKSITTVNLGA